MTLDELLHEYDKTHHKYESCKQSTERLIQTILDKAGVRVHKVECRVKHRESLRRKIELKRGKYEQLSEITDLVAFRIITFFEDEVDKVAEVIRKEFDIDVENSIDKRLKDSEKFGYQSLHYVLTYKKERIDLPEYSAYKELKYEIQIRSILQHAWAEIEHDIGYKSGIGIPLPAKRNFMRVAALLETADLEFIRLRDTLYEYQEKIITEVANETENILIDKVSLITYIKHSDLLKEIDNSIASNEQSGLYFSDDLEIELKRLEYFNIGTIGQLDNVLKENAELIKAFANKWLYKYPFASDGIHNGITLFYLAYILSAKEYNKSDIVDYLEQSAIIVSSIQETAEEVLSIYKEIASTREK